MKTYHDMKEDKSILEYTETKEFPKYDIEIYRDCLKENIDIFTKDQLEYLLRKLELVNLKENGSLLESAISEDMLSGYLPKNNKETISSYIPTDVPYFTPEEIIAYGGSNTEFVRDYKRNCASGLVGYDYNKPLSVVQGLYEELQRNPSIELEQQIISLGWNPSVEPTTENMKIARRRISNYLDENYNLEFIDLTGTLEAVEVPENNRQDLYPIFIVLSFTNTTMGKVINKVKKGHYSHACIAFESDLRHLYSFNFDNKTNVGGGLSYESIQDYQDYYDKSTIKVMAVFVDRTQKSKIHAKLDYYISNTDKTRYDVANLIRIIFNKKGSNDFNLHMVCSQFVDAMLRAVDIDLTHKNNNLVAPDDFEKVKDARVYTLFEGYIADYDPKEVDKKVKALCANKANQYKVVELKEVVDLLCHQKHPLLYKAIRFTNEEANEILDEIVDIVTPKSIFTEAIKFPISIKNNGDIEINFPEQLEEEYQKSHKLLLEYDKSGNIEGMKSELAKLWYLNNIAEKKMKGIKKDATIKTRARILNDFKKYLSKILDQEKDFNFAEYFNNSPYYDKSIKIDASTLKWTGRLLRALTLTK